jgi:ABC-type antimicrobial peptide transport system permease subunit
LGSFAYGWRNLQFRNESKLLLLGQAITLASSIFSFLLAGNFTESLIRFDDRLLINTTLTNRYAAFVIIIAFLSFISAVSFYLMTLRTLFQTKKKDVALMLASGGLIEKIQDRLISELMIISVLSNLVSILIGNILFYFAMFYLVFQNFQIFIQITFMDVLTFSIIFSVIFFIISYIFASFIVIRSVKNYYSEILSGEILPLQKIRIWSHFFIPSTKIEKIITKLARINFSRTFNIVKSHFLSLLLLTAILASVLFGSFSIRDSTIQAMDQGIGNENLYAISDPNMREFIENGYSLFSQTNSSLDFLNFTFSETITKNLLINQGISSKDIEFKLITYVTVTSIYEQDIDPNNYNIFRQTGETFLIAQSMNETFSNWQFFGKNPKLLASNEIAVGESTAWEILTNPLENREDLLINKTSKTFTVKTMLIDPLLKGKTIYISFSQLSAVFDINLDLRNLGIVKIDSTATFQKISQTLSELVSPLVLVPLQPIIDRNAEFQNSLGNILLLIVFPTILAYIIAIITYSTTIIDFRREIFHILKSLGADRKTIEVSVSKEIWGMIFWGFFIGTFSGLIFILGLVIPEPVISIEAIFIFATILLLTILTIKKFISFYIDKYYDNSLY